MYLWEQAKWPSLTWDTARLAGQLAQVSREQGRLVGRMEELGFDLRREAHLSTLTEDVVRSSEIEGEKLDNEQVRSSLARRLGMDIGGLLQADRNVEGVVEMMLDATSNYAQPLTAERLFNWHAALFPTGQSGLQKILVGQWRDDASGPMQVVSGPIGRRSVHYEAPPAARVPVEMESFLAWFAAPGHVDPLLTAGLAHLWFVTIHPFDDGNGRIARAIGDLALARSEHSPQRFYSMSAQIRRERDTYYTKLERTQRGGLERHFVAGMVPVMPAPCNRRIARNTCPGPRQGALLGPLCAGIAERKASESTEPVARWVRGKIDDLEMGQACQMFPGYGLPRHPRSCRAWRTYSGSCRRTQHDLLISAQQRDQATRIGLGMPGSTSDNESCDTEPSLSTYVSVTRSPVVVQTRLRDTRTSTTWIRLSASRVLSTAA